MEQYIFSVITALISGIITFLISKNSNKKDIDVLMIQNKADIDKLVNQHKINVGN